MHRWMLSQESLEHAQQLLRDLLLAICIACITSHVRQTGTHRLVNKQQIGLPSPSVLSRLGCVLQTEIDGTRFAAVENELKNNNTKMIIWMCQRNVLSGRLKKGNDIQNDIRCWHQVLPVGAERGEIALSQRDSYPVVHTPTRRCCPVWRWN